MGIAGARGRRTWVVAWLAAALAVGCDDGEGGAATDGAIAGDDGGRDAAAGDAGPRDDGGAPAGDAAPDAGPRPGDAGADAVPPGDTGIDAAPPGDAGPPPGRCPDFDPLRRPLFGDLHVHTSYSFDSYGLRNSRSGPREAYAFARGEEITVPPYEDGESTRPPVRIDRPLDFAAVTDHSEFLGEVSLCTDETSPAYDTASCRNFRTSSDFEERIGTDVSFLGWGIGLATGDGRPPFCQRPGVDCEAAAADAWARTQAITEEANRPCEFTALHAYEYTGQVGGSMNHRNVIFRNATVPARPISAFEAANWEELARALRRACNDAGTGCEALAIPHNPNYSNGVMFAPTDGDGEPLTAETARLRAEMEPLVEIIQTKEESECRNGFSRYAGPADELCDFEKRDPGVPFCGPGEVPCGPGETPEEDGCAVCLRECAEGETGGGCVAPQDYVRNALKIGLEQVLSIGVNPFRLGFIGSTDTHNATPGDVDEEDFGGHHGFQDDETDELLDENAVNALAVEPNPGGLAAVWAEENTREAIFAALKRRETYATSGPRMVVRFFGGADLPVDLCDRPDAVSTAYETGVSMGGRLAAGAGARFAVMALRDPEGAPLERLQIVKVWIDADGTPRERVFDLTTPAGPADVDLDTCAPRGAGHDELCAVWTDPDFDPSRPAAWYARVVQNPTCRWTRWLCVREGITCDGRQPPEGCCDPDVPKTIRERAWTSPIYHTP